MTFEEASPTPPDLDLSFDGGVGRITLNRPDSLNALSPAMTAGLPAALRDLASDRSCRSIIITGAGRAFCAGIDVTSVASRDAAAPSDIGAQFENLHISLGNIIRTIHQLPIPVIAAVNGASVGAGFAIAAACDLRIGSDRAMFMDGFVTRGISGCELGLSYFLPKLVGAASAFEWMTTGRRVHADEALTAGLISRVVDGSDLLDAAAEIAAQISSIAPMAVTMTKEVMWANLHAPSLDHALAMESRTQVMTRNTTDAREARNSFIEKRPPEFGATEGTRPLR